MVFSIIHVYFEASQIRPSCHAVFIDETWNNIAHRNLLWYQRVGICGFNIFGVLWKWQPVGIEQYQKCVEPSIKIAAQPVGDYAIYDELFWVISLVMFIRVFTKDLPVTWLT